MTKERNPRRPETGRYLTLSGMGTLSSGEYDEIRVEGVGRITGDITCTQLCVNGSVTVHGHVRAKRVDIEGTCHVDGDVQAEEVNISGWMRVRGDINAEVFHARGAFKVGGLLNADRIDVAAHGPSRVREIGGGTIVIHGERTFPFVFGRFRRFQAESMEGDEIQLTGVQARVVRGRIVEIGEECDIDIVEYQSEYRQAKDAKVRNRRRV